MQNPRNQNSNHDIAGHAAQFVGDHGQQYGAEADSHDPDVGDDITHGFQKL